MNASTALGLQSPQFEAFLFALVGEDSKGMLVSVLSALARFGVDPWREAEVLSNLSQADAASRLDRMILALADVPSAVANHSGIATRLIALLLQAGTIQTTMRKAIRVAPLEQRSLAIVWTAFMVISLIGQTISYRPDAGVSGSETSGSTTASISRPDAHKP
ncbi:site-specific integrase [Cypionkella psychrotolerans]|uniref:hypothetical protein n=1 Tax=Cypionkella psychrotolerans TaxID=1678131 RepID=UPI0006B49C1B|nr:hypothetical protein [Cypionkella psychrotolerans]